MTTMIEKKKPGRKPKYGESTVAIRVPVSLVPTIKKWLTGDKSESSPDVSQFIEAWESKLGTSPRYHFARVLLTELKTLCQHDS